MKQMKKLILFLVAVNFSCALWAQSGAIGNLKWNLSGGTLTISGSGAMQSAETTAGSPWYNYRSKIKKIIIEKGVTNIGDGAFAHCLNLTSVSIPNSVKRIDSYAFYYCESLTSVDIPNSVTSIRKSAFSNCTKLNSIVIPSNVASIEDEAFWYCLKLTQITVSWKNPIEINDKVKPKLEKTGLY